MESNSALPTDSTIGPASAASAPGWALRTGTLVLVVGRLDSHKTNGYSLVRTRSAVLRVYWVERILPPDIFVGRMVCLAGKIKSFDNGASLIIVEAVPIPGGKKATAPIFECLDHIVADPREWMS